MKPTRQSSRLSSAPQNDVRLDHLVRLLTAHATVVVSGTKLSDELQTSRSEVWRMVEELRRYRVDIEGHPATGYSLKSVPDLLLPDTLLPSLRGTIFDRISHYYSAGSTNDAAMQAASEGAPEGCVFLAEQQTKGRGRGDHQWDSAQSAGIYCSVILRPGLIPSEILILSLAVGLAVRDAVRDVDDRTNPDLKWPNDLLINGRKFCGILTEMNAEVTRVRYIVVGVGINVNQFAFPPTLQSSATSLRLETGTQWSRVELCAALLKSLHREYRQLIENPDARASILQRFQDNSSMVRGKQVVIIEENGQFNGVTEGLDERGFLNVRTPQSLRTILSGTVRLEE